MPMVAPVDGYIETLGKVSNTCLVTLDRNRYIPLIPCALHRFRSAQRDFTTANWPEGFKLSEFLEKHGNFGEGKWITLKAKVNANLADILLETPLGKNQQLGLPDSEGNRELEVMVRDNWQLRWWLQAQGRRVIVSAPQALREILIRNATFLAQAYGMPQR